ncbi:DNA helicase PcrA [Candidatus Peregrinibacteria bacterium CG10_big_fil_rev_8_21_14_0_10_36_19]|nr:MAG: DNA helicase PcrA [Candidatus Peregrinibacteria bacterium CG10_big_fil_rev_8_21_14_0_10_36_19]
MSKILENLNPAQLEAVTHYTGPLLVIAGAGSGKTRALTHRIAYLIEERGVSPWNILAVTFTNKAAAEMKHRLTKLLSRQDELAVLEGFGDILAMGEVEKIVDQNLPTVGTFHSICVRILRKHIQYLDYETSFAIYDTADQQILVKRIMTEMLIDPKKINPKAVLAHISNAKNQLIAPDDYAQFASDYFNDKVAEIYPRYQRALKKSNALDFDDIIMKTVELFQTFPNILELYQEKFKFICVDEYQDTNHAQYTLIKMLADKYKNLCVIGDADQSIYSWRGATIQNILDFEKDYPDCKVALLEENYRSTQIILDAANAIIEKNDNRKEKKLWTQKGEGEKLVQWICDNERHEGQMVAQEIERLLIGSEYPIYNDFVVLYRTNAQSRVMEEVFLRHGIPYKIVGGIKFYERKEVKDILAYLRLIQNPSDIVSLLRIINVPSRKVGAKTLESLQNFAVRNNISLFNAMLLVNENPDFSPAKAEQINKFVHLIRDLQKLNGECSASAMIKHVLSDTGYKTMLNDGSVEGEARLENIKELISVSQKYDKLEAGMSLNIFLEEVSLISDLDSMDQTDNAVTLMTIHSAKGLEFPYVFLVGLEEGIFPHSRSLLNREELEEERRLMYVAMTRAMEKLYLLHTRSRTLYGESKSNAPSQFLADLTDDHVERNFGGNSTRKHISVAEMDKTPIPIELDKGVDTDLSSGDRVMHNAFGAGIVVNITGGVITIAFEDSRVGVKKLALSVAPLKRIS